MGLTQAGFFFLFCILSSVCVCVSAFVYTRCLSQNKRKLSSSWDSVIATHRQQWQSPASRKAALLRITVCVLEPPASVHVLHVCQSRTWTWGEWRNTSVEAVKRKEPLHTHTQRQVFILVAKAAWRCSVSTREGCVIHSTGVCLDGSRVCCILLCVLWLLSEWVWRVK